MTGGYCTIFNCEPGGCPDEAVCVAYQTVPSTEAACRDTSAGTRLTRTFCMRSCNSGGDCRRGYACVDLSEVNPWGAAVVEKGSANQKICTVPASSSEGPEPASQNETEVCNPPPLDAGALPDSSPGGATGRDAALDAQGDR